jgi:RHS repeat-associated protein
MNESVQQAMPTGEEGIWTPPSITLPKGGGAIRGMGEKFAANPVNGSGALSVPLPVSPGRAGFAPQLTLSYDSASGNGPFGLGWSLSLPSITRKTDKGLPLYRDEEESDTFILSGYEDLVPVLAQTGGRWTREPVTRTVANVEYRVQAYRPRVEGLFARVERWTRAETGETHWRSITKENVTTLYGKDDGSRIYDQSDDDPLHPRRVFGWLISETWDDKGNAIVYEYRAENEEGVDLARPCERNRAGAARTANRYLKRIKYGNRVSRLSDPGLQQPGWMFEVVFDYGEHDADAPLPDDAGAWPCRHDPFSVYRAGFEIRTYRLCQRVLMFHHFPGEDGVGQNCLVRSTDFAYQSKRGNPADAKQGHPVASFISRATQNGYRRDGVGYVKRSLPPLEFEYSEAVVSEGLQEVDGESLENLPAGLDDSLYLWVDLDGEGVSGILSRQAEGWFYKRNLSPVRTRHDDGGRRNVAAFAPVEVVATQPSLADRGPGRRQHFLDLAGDGQLDLVQFERPLPGFYERTEDGDWSPFAPFRCVPNVAWEDPNLKFVDLTGDGLADIIVSEDNVFTWYRSLAEDGFGAAERVHKALDEERGPRVVFADGTESIYLADMSGDGLTDIVRVRNGEVCYWPSLGYGRFGAKVTMDDAPLLDLPDQFDQRRVRLADIDGSGVTDIIYLGGDGVDIYFNQCGNGWGEGRRLEQFPRVDDLASVSVVDLLGNDTACLVWSSPLPDEARRRMRYVDLMGGRKPHLLTGVRNNMGAEVRVSYAPSTRFYLEDKLAGRPWVTRLPFPVHVIERVETIDHVSRNRFVSRYSYHHGYFDGAEREFRGFGMVEQWDTEEIGSLPEDEDSSAASNLDAASFVPPVHTRSWFHTGAHLGPAHVASHFAALYYREPGLSDAEAKAQLLADAALPEGLTAAEEREASRALKGALLRQEIYGLDGTDKAAHPYAVTDLNYTVERVQPRGPNRHAVFFTHGREALSRHYERDPEDPRVAHSLTLEVDGYGNVLKSVAVGYGRGQSPLDQQQDRDRQTRTLVTYSERDTTLAIDDDARPDDYRSPLACEARTYELTGYAPAAAGQRFGISDFVEPDATDPEGRRRIHLFDDELSFEETATSGRQRRLLGCARTFYRKDDLSGLLPLGHLEPLALPGRSYKLAFTPGLLAQVYQRQLGASPVENLLPSPAQVLGGTGDDRGGYVDLDADGRWWVPSGRLFYSDAADPDDPASTAASELSEAAQHFFLPRKFTDQFDKEGAVDYDAHDLLIVKTEDAAENAATAVNDYRLLRPRLTTDPNGNRSEVRFDALGMVVGVAVMGKAAGPAEGDSFDDFTADLTPQQIKDYFDSPDPRPLALALLGTATKRVVYDLERVPTCAASIERETHASDLAPGEETEVRLSFAYSDGFGRVAQTKAQAEPGPLDPRDPASPALDPRWVGTGTIVHNNKGMAVRRYEPFFSATHHHGVEQHGVSSTMFYDAAGRLVATLHPNHTWEKVVVDPWRQAAYDVNDTVQNADGSTDPKADDDVTGFFSRLPDADYLPSWYEQRASLPADDPERVAAVKASLHRQTPTVTHLDTLGRPFLTVVHNRFERDGNVVEERYAGRVELDIQGREKSLRDAVVQNNDPLGRVVMRREQDMLGSTILQASMEAGRRWTLNDAGGKLIRAWDSRGSDWRVAYDSLRRPTELFVTENGVERLAERTVYGEGQGAAGNHRMRVYQIADGAGVTTSEQYDFKGNLLSRRRDLLADYKGDVDWQQNPTPDDGTYTTGAAFDALNRFTAITTPDESTYRQTYNEAGLLETVEVNLRGAQDATPFVTNVDYDAKGRRTLVQYANGAATAYAYDALTLRLVRLKTTRGGGQNGVSSQIFAAPTIVQDLGYTYDPAGNITRIEDAALLTVFHDGQQIEPVGEYTYDAVYRLIEASGREHVGQAALDFNVPGGSLRDHHFAGHGANPNDLQALRNYTERYEYDAVGNFEKMIHQAGPQGGWTRTYSYDEPSLLEPAAKKSNRLSAAAVGQSVETYDYDAHGNMTAMPQLTLMGWNFKDELRVTSKQAVNSGTPETTYYVYDAAGQRARKVTERQNGSRKCERVYVSGFEVYREYDGAGSSVTLERETLHLFDDRRRVASVETKTVEGGSAVNAPPVQRYQLDNHLGSASLELDANGALISYEEYHPYGTTAYQAFNGAAEVSLKRYRYVGKERDEETGLYYYGARYYACWLGRWASADPAGTVDGTNLYLYVRANPVGGVDANGTQTSSPGADDYLFQGNITIDGKEYRQYTNFAGDFEWVEPVDVEVIPPPVPQPKKPPVKPGPPKELLEEFEKYKDSPEEPVDEPEEPDTLEVEVEGGLLADGAPVDVPDDAPQEEPATGEEGSLRNNPVVQFLAGAAVGGLQGWVPLGVLGNSVNMPTKNSELGRGVGEAAMGVAQLIGGIGAIIGGGTAAVGGAVGAPVTGGASLLVTMGGGAVVVAGWAAVIQGATNIVAGASSISHSMSMSDPPPPEPHELVPSVQKPRPLGSTPHPMADVPKEMRPHVFDIMADLQAARAGDTAAAARLAARNQHVLTGDYAGWTSLDIMGRENPLRFLFKEEAGGIKWMIANTHAH